MSLHKPAWCLTALFGSIIAFCASPLLSSSKSTLSFQLKPQAVLIIHSGGSFPVSLSPGLEFENLKVKLIPIVNKVKFDLSSGRAIEIPCLQVKFDKAELDAKIVLKWSKKEESAAQMGAFETNKRRFRFY